MQETVGLLFSDGFFGDSFGTVTLSEWDNNIIYGEKTIRENVSSAGNIWKLKNTRKT